jgi:hypothetical protein
MKKLIAGIVLLIVLAMVAAAVAAPAQAKAKTWHYVITMSGGDETYTDQYSSRPFKLRGGKLKLVAHVIPDPELEELDMADWWGATYYVERISNVYSNSFYAQMDPEQGGTTYMWWTFRLPKGRYFTHPITWNCEWRYTIYEKR